MERESLFPELDIGIADRHHAKATADIRLKAEIEDVLARLEAEVPDISEAEIDNEEQLFEPSEQPIAVATPQDESLEQDQDEDYSLESLSLYLRQITQFPLRPHQEIVALATQRDAGDLEAVTQIINANLRLVVSVAKNYRNLGLPFMDLIQEGNLGLIRAAERFDQTRGIRFSTYAVINIRGYVTRALTKKSRTIRAPFELAQIEGKVVKTYNDLRAELGRRPNLDEVAKVSGISKEKVIDIIDGPRVTSSLNQPVSHETGTAELGELLTTPYNLEEETLQDIHTDQQNETLYQLMKEVLPKRHQELLIYRYGLNGTSPLSREEISRRFRITSERVRQLEDWALRLLWSNRERELRVGNLTLAAASGKSQARYIDSRRRAA